MQRPRSELYGASTVLGLHAGGAVIGISRVLHAQTPGEGDRYAMARLAELLAQPDADDATAFIFRLPGDDLKIRSLLEEVARRHGIEPAQRQHFSETLKRAVEQPVRSPNPRERILLRQLQDFLAAVGEAMLALTARY